MCLSTFTKKTEEGLLHLPCGRCYECLQKRRAEWTIRLLNELKVSSSAKFLTLTYEDDNLPYDIQTGEIRGRPNVNKRDVQLFIKRLRKENAKNTNRKISYYAASEYGSKTLRPHYHIIIFNLHPKIYQKVDKIWNLGHVHFGEVNQASIHYTTGYIIEKQFIPEGCEEPFALMSKKLGLNYCLDKNGKLKPEVVKYHNEKKDMSMHINESKFMMPRYYKQRLFKKEDTKNITETLIKNKDKKEAEKKLKIEKKGKDYYQFIDRLQKARTNKMRKQSKI